MAHKDICIKFEEKGRRFEAVGFLDEGKTYVTGDEMLARTAGENGSAIGDEDEAFLWEYRDCWPNELRPYLLVINRHGPGGQRRVSCFLWNGDSWDEDWLWLGDCWFGSYLVLRRCA